MVHGGRIAATLALCGVVGGIVWAQTRSELYWVDEQRLADLALEDLRHDVILLQRLVAEAESAIRRFESANGRPPASFSDLVPDFLRNCGPTPRGLASWADTCGVVDSGVAWFYVDLIPGDPRRVRASGCRYYGRKLGCLRFPDRGLPDSCQWCAARSRSVNGWRMTLQPPPDTG